MSVYALSLSESSMLTKIEIGFAKKRQEITEKLEVNIKFILAT